MSDPVVRILSYLPNPRVWKSLIAAEYCGVDVEAKGTDPATLSTWLWDFDARRLEEDERVDSSPHARKSHRGFSGTLFKTDAFLEAHPFGTVPAAFSPDGEHGIFESNSILRSVVRAANDDKGLYGKNGYEASRIDSFLDANLVFAREAQVYLLALRDMSSDTHERMAGAYGFYLDGLERALESQPFLCGSTLSLADISFACDFGQFLDERRARKYLGEKGLAPISSNEPEEHPRVFDHLFRLVERPEFAKHFGDRLERTREEMEGGVPNGSA